MNFEEDDEEILEKVHDSMERLDQGLPVDPTWHSPDWGPKGYFFKPSQRRGIADAVSTAGLPFLGGAPRNPPLAVGDSEYSVVRYAEGQYAYTRVSRTKQWCPDCSRKRVEVFHFQLVAEDGAHASLGNYGVCHGCNPTHWLFESHMNTVPYRPFAITVDPDLVVAATVMAFIFLLLFLTMS